MLVTAAGGVAGVVAAPWILGAAGFTSAGVAAGCVVGGVQGIVYGGATGCVFSVLQATTAGGMSTLAKLTAGAAGAEFTKMMYGACEKLSENC